MTMSMPLQLCVERRSADRTLVRVAGRLDQDGGARLLRLLDGMLHPPANRGRRPEIVMLDLGEVRSFDRGGLAALRHAGHSAGATGVTLQVIGLAGRSAPLPRRVVDVLDGLEHAPVPAS